jgi:ribosomal protein L12E/L44/L45/RPP1/RPP2
MATKKARAKSAKVTYDAPTAHKLASSLRRGLAGSMAYFVSEPGGQQRAGARGLPKAVSVDLDPRRVASFVKHIHDKLHAAGAITERERNEMTPKPNGGAARKSSGGAGAKKSTKKSTQRGAKKGR